MVIRIGLLTAVISVFAYLIQRNEFLFSASVLGILILSMLAELLYYIENTNRRLKLFLDTIRHADFSANFSRKPIGKSFHELDEAFATVIHEFKKHRTEKEEQYNYLNTVVEHIATGLIAYTENGDVHLFNKAASRLLGIIHLKNIEGLIMLNPDLPELLRKINPGEKFLLSYSLDDEMIQLAVHATRFKMKMQIYTLVSLQNIHAELEEKEIESWQKLIRVLTHEMMNSITPISSLAGTISDILIGEDGSQLTINALDDEDSESIINALKIITKRSNGLLNFVELYRNLTRIPKPVFRYFPIQSALENIRQLLSTSLDNKQIDLQLETIPFDLHLLADPDLLDQVLINIILNAMDALDGCKNPVITVKAYKNTNKQTIIEVMDNGIGITEDILDKIFIPFFTSKPEGSGIGLSLSRQIMHLHKGSINARSKQGEGSVFTLCF